MATIILGVVGAVVGGVAGGGLQGAMIGWSVGTTIGSWIDQSNKHYYTPDMGKLSDLRVTVASYGTSIPLCYGITRVNASLIWGMDLEEHEQETTTGGASGGPQVTTRTYSYTTSFAAMVCAGKSTNRIDKIYADDIVIFDRSQSGNTITAINDSFATQVGETIISAAFPDVTIRYYFGTETQNADPLIISSASNSYLTAGADNPAFRGLCYIVFQDMLLTKFGNRIPNINCKVNTGTTYASTIITELVGLTGLSTGTYLDVTAITAIAVTGMVVPSRVDAKSAIQPLLDAYSIDLIDVDGKIKAVVRGGATVRTLSWADLGVTTINSGSAPETQRVTKTRADRSNITSRLDVGYFGTAIDLQQATQGAVRQSARQVNLSSRQYPLSLTDDEGRKLAEKLLYLEWTESEVYRATGLISLSNLTVADPVLLQIDALGNTQRVRITEVETAEPGMIQFSMVKENSDVYSQSITGVVSTGGLLVKDIVPTDFFAWSGKEVRYEDTLQAGFYVVARGNAGWEGGVVYVSYDSGTTYTLAGTVSRRGIWGVVDSVLSDTPVIDGVTGLDTNTFDVIVNGDLSDTNTTAVYGGQGNYGVVMYEDRSVPYTDTYNYEILGFSDVTLITAGNYTLTQLYRGLIPGLDTLLENHTITDVFVLLTDAVVRVNTPSASDAVSSVWVKVVSPGVDITTVSPQILFIEAASNYYPTTQSSELNAIEAANAVRTPYWRIRGYLGGTKTTGIDDTYFLNGDGTVNSNCLLNQYTLTLNAVAGSYTITVNDLTTGVSDTTASITRSANAATVTTALEALSNVGAGNVTVTGGPGGTSPLVIQYTGYPLNSHEVTQVATGTAGVVSSNVQDSQATLNQFWEESSLSPIDIVWRYETPGMGYTLYARINIDNNTGADVDVNWWVPARDNTLRIKVGGTLIYDNDTNNLLGTFTVVNTATDLVEIFYYNDPAIYTSVDPGVAMFKTDAIAKGLTWSDAGK